MPKRLKVDNLKAAVQRNQRYELEFNQDFLEFARHYTTVIVPCTPYSPEQKGKVESGIKYLQQNFVNGRVFTDSRDIAHKLKDWMTSYANQRVHGTGIRLRRDSGNTTAVTQQCTACPSLAVAALEA